MLGELCDSAGGWERAIRIRYVAGGTRGMRWAEYQPSIGATGTTLDPVEFFTLVGRPERAREFQDLQSRYHLLLGSTLGVAAAGLGLSVASFFVGSQTQCPGATPPDACGQRGIGANSTLLTIGILTMFTGVVGAALSTQVRPTPYRSREVLTNVDRYNGILWTELGRPNATPTASSVGP